MADPISMSGLMDGAAGSVKAAGRTLPSRVLDWLYPPVCVHCGTHVDQPHGLCAPCWTKLRPITKPFCPVLGLPFEADLGPDVISAEAIADPPPFGRARSALVYGDVARSVVSALKFGDRTELAGFCAGLMAYAGADILADRPVLVPVPLHRGRQWQRRYNQSALLAEALAGIYGLDCDPFLVRRTKPTRQQVGLNASQRARNVQGAFAAAPDLLDRTGGKPVLIVDDVITTGSTVKAVTRALSRAGAGQIDVISFARVVTGADATI